MSAALELRKAVRSRLAQDTALSGLLGGAKVFDEVPPSAGAPFIVLADIESRLAGALPEEGEEHRLAVNLWSDAGGLAEALGAAAQVAHDLDAPISFWRATASPICAGSRLMRAVPRMAGIAWRSCVFAP